MSDILVLHNAVDKIATADDRGLAVFEESNTSLMGQVASVTGALKTLGISYQVKSVESLGQLPDLILHNHQKIIFNLVEELPGDMLHACYVPALCRTFGRACTGSDTPALLLAQNKWHTKAILKAGNIPIPQGTIVPPGQPMDVRDLPEGKYFVKPVFSDASEGIDAQSVVDLPGPAMEEAIRRIHARQQQPALVEQFIPNRELNVSVLQDKDKIQVLPLAEIVFGDYYRDKPRIVDYAAKWHTETPAYTNTNRVIPAPLSQPVADRVRQTALAAWHALGCQDYVRVDFRLDDRERPFVLEVNTNPDISPEAGFAAALAAAGIHYVTFIETVVNNASLRKP